MKQGISPKEFAVRINTLRSEISSTQTVYTSKDVAKLLREYGIPASHNYVQKYVDNGIICKVRKNEYKFPTKPAYVGVIEKILNEIREEVRKKNDKFRSKEEIVEESIIEEPNDEDKISRCIDFLKQKGFMILRQV